MTRLIVFGSAARVFRLSIKTWFFSLGCVSFIGFDHPLIHRKRMIYSPLFFEDTVECLPSGGYQAVTIVTFRRELQGAGVSSPTATLILGSLSLLVPPFQKLCIMSHKRVDRRKIYPAFMRFLICMYHWQRVPVSWMLRGFPIAVDCRKASLFC